MKKKNEKGFILAEAIVVGIFVLSLFTFLFVNIIPLVGEYEANQEYDTIDGVYNANLVRSMILNDADVIDILTLGSAPYKYYTGTGLCNNLNYKNMCLKLVGEDFLNIKGIYVTWYRSEPIKTASKGNVDNFSRAAREYIEQLESFDKPSGTTYDRYKRLIINYNDGTFANIEVKVGVE